jgi:hypothetical protein
MTIEQARTNARLQEVSYQEVAGRDKGTPNKVLRNSVQFSYAFTGRGEPKSSFSSPHPPRDFPQHFNSTRAKQPNLQLAKEVTRRSRAFDPDDPVKYNFAFCRLGVLKRPIPDFS